MVKRRFMSSSGWEKGKGAEDDATRGLELRVPAQAASRYSHRCRSRCSSAIVVVPDWASLGTSRPSRVCAHLVLRLAHGRPREGVAGTVPATSTSRERSRGVRRQLQLTSSFWEDAVSTADPESAKSRSMEIDAWIGGGNTGFIGHFSSVPRPCTPSRNGSRRTRVASSCPARWSARGLRLPASGPRGVRGCDIEARKRRRIGPAVRSNARPRRGRGHQVGEFGAGRFQGLRITPREFDRLARCSA